MVKIERTPAQPASLAKKISYREPDVIRQLNEDFHGKCYLCEIDKLQSAEVEHLQPHGGGEYLKYKWDNLFLSCAHCNSVKNQKKYDGKILDCCKTDPEAVLEQILTEGHICVRNLVDTPEARQTAKLLTECFEKTNTGIRIIECQTRINALNGTMNLLYKALEKYRQNPAGHNLCVLRGMLSRTYKFAGFTRTYVRMHLADYPGLAEYVQL